jgi:hypothetical protein
MLDRHFQIGRETRPAALRKLAHHFLQAPQEGVNASRRALRKTSRAGAGERTRHVA